MTLEELIDIIVSTGWLFVTVVFIAMMASGCFFFLKPLRRQWLNITLGIILAGVFIYIMIFATRGAYGYAVEFTEIHSNGQQVCLEERHEVGDGDGGTSTAYRIYILDLKTGKRLLRETLPYANILDLTNDSYITYEYDEVVKRDLFNGKEIKVWTKEKGFEKFDELASGINSFGSHKQEINGKTKGYLTITALNGHEYFFDPANEKLFTERPADQPIDRYAFSFASISSHIQRLVRYRPSEKFYGKELLEPEILFYDEGKNLVILKHYTTLEKDNAVLTGLTYDLQERWQLQQTNLQLEDKFEEKPVYGTSMVVGDDLIITFGGTVLCLEAATGTERWRNRL
jgi:hypothetical protein